MLGKILSEECLAALCVQIQHLFKEVICPEPLLILQSHIAPLEQRSQIAV